ncbi:hypothetical protein H8356DRAFT_949217, partial [Neocallimastix lanati (nom. inval.)]
FLYSPKFSNQVFITRTYIKDLNSFYTTSFSILKNKKKKSNKYGNNTIIIPKNFHCYFEKDISNLLLFIIIIIIHCYHYHYHYYCYKLLLLLL